MALTDKIGQESQKANSKNVGVPAHEVIYQKLRDKILYGDFKPGKAVTLQGIAEELQVSLTPIRESVRRLIAERALEFHGNRRISVPVMTEARLEEIYTARISLETELMKRALNSVTSQKIDVLRRIDEQVDVAINEGDTYNYLKYNFEFHYELYNMKDSEIILPMVRTLWLQLGPSQRVVCGRYGTSGLSDQHKNALRAIDAGDHEGALEAIREDILQGRQLIREELAFDGK